MMINNFDMINYFTHLNFSFVDLKLIQYYHLIKIIYLEIILYLEFMKLVKLFILADFMKLEFYFLND
jgi:hypothetical protein